MPYIDVKVFENELDEAQSARLIEQITQAVCDVADPALRADTWVTITEVKDGQWGVGGKPLGLADVKAMIASAR